MTNGTPVVSGNIFSAGISHSTGMEKKLPWSLEVKFKN